MPASETFKIIFKVIYAPHKAFKEIIQNPKYLGPVLVVILFSAAYTGFTYVAYSKVYYEQTLPIAEDRDKWTENSALWTGTTGLDINENYDDYINGTYYGNKSIQFSMNNSKQISMELNDIGSIDCLGSDGYKNISLRTKIADPEVKPENVTIYLFSTTPSDFFYYDLTTVSSFDNNIWNNLTIPLESEGWLSSGDNANWDSITGLRLEFAWLDYSNMTLLVDGLFFRGIFRTQIEAFGSGILFNSLLDSFMLFIVRWVFLGGLLYIMTRAFGAKTVWRTLLICIGFVFVTLFIQAVLTAMASASLPRLFYPLELLGGVEGEFETAANKIWEETWVVIEFSRYLQMTVYMWTIGLCTIATRSLTEFSWSKSILLSTVAFLISLLIIGIIFPYSTF